MTDWSDFAVVTGGAAAALMGLLFVAVTLRIDAIARARDLRSRAAQTLTLFAVALVAAVLVTVPGQPRWVLGVEVVWLAVLGGAAMLALNNRAQRVPREDPIARILDRVGPNGSTIVLVGLAGILTASGTTWGIYLLLPAELAALIGGVLSAWVFLTSIPAGDRRNGGES
jgi:hypothetical protein